MSDNLFLPSAVKDLYILPGTTGWVAYILPQDYAQAPASISLEESLNKYPGSYLFSATCPDIERPDFITKFRTYLNKHYTTAKQFSKRCFFWLNPENESDNSLLGQALIFEKFNYWGTSENLHYASRSQHLDINANIFMALPPFCSITVVENQLLIARMPTSVFSTAQYGLFLNNLKKNESIRIGKIDTRGVSKEVPVSIPLTGANRGCLKFDLSFPFSFKKPAYFECENDYYPYIKSGDQQNEYTILDTGLKYFYTDQTKKEKELIYDLFQQDTPAKFKASIDFTDIFNTRNPRRSYFAFTGKNETKAQEDTILPTAFISNYGRQITGKPITTLDADNNPSAYSALLVFSQGIESPTAQKRYCWTLQGDFELNTIQGVPGSNRQEMLLCGISGTETISFIKAAENNPGDRISFYPGQPAYAPGFGTKKDKTLVSTNQALLTDRYTTAWGTIRKATATEGTPNNYYSQPSNAPLFEPGKQSGSLDYAAVPSADLSILDPQKKESFPLAPSARPLQRNRPSGKTQGYTPADLQNFEIEVLNPARKQAISTYQKAYKKPVKKLRKASSKALKSISAECPIEQLTTTPQGFLVNLTQDKTAWKCLTLANNEPKGAEQYQVPLRFKNIDTQNSLTGLQSAFQTNEQFLVISNPAQPDHPEVLQYYIDNFQNQISIADWPFILDIAHQNKSSNTEAAFSNIMIFKFCNRSIEERIKDPSLWTDAQVFNQTKQIPALIQWIENYIATARKTIQSNNTIKDGTSPQDKGFRQFIDIIENPAWQGILCLQVTLNPENLPREIKAIMAGISPGGFAAHHLGFEANQIKTNDSQQLDVQFKSSLFGMISYFNPVYLAYQNGTLPRPAIYPESRGDYDFQVLDLQILFANSLIADFHASIQLNLNTVFDEMVVDESATENTGIYCNSIIMQGQYDKKNGNISYTFAVRQANTLSLASTAIDTVNITAIELSTVDETVPKEKQDANAADTLMTTRFKLSGFLKFKTIGDFDLFSYEQLAFSNLVLDMQFNLQDIDPADQTPRKTFSFKPAAINFNKSNSISRPGSLAQHFPIELQNLMYHSPDTDSEAGQDSKVNPESLGYMRVEAPLPTAPVDNYWYALRFRLNLGTVGALAAKVGFEASLILAWCPGKSNNQTHMYVKMPFSGGGSGGSFSIEGVLKFAIGSVLFFNDPVKKEYAMIFTEVGVSLLGKKLPPNGSTVLYLFGNPDSPAADASGSSNLAWFGAYKQNKKKEKGLKKLKAKR